MPLPEGFIPDNTPQGFIPNSPAPAGGGLGGFVPDKTPNYETLVRAEASRAGLDPNLAARLAKFESGFNPNAISSAGAVGVMQVMPFANRGNIKDPYLNIQKGMELWKDALKRAGGDPDKAYRLYYNPGYTGAGPFGSPATPPTPTRSSSPPPRPERSSRPQRPTPVPPGPALVQQPSGNGVGGLLGRAGLWVQQHVAKPVEDWFHSTPLGKPQPLSARSPESLAAAERMGLTVDEAGNVHDPKTGKILTDTELMQILSAVIPAGPAPFARGAQRILQRTGSVRSTSPLRPSERGISQLTDAPVHPTIPAGQAPRATEQLPLPGIASHPDRPTIPTPPISPPVAGSPTRQAWGLERGVRQTEQEYAADVVRVRTEGQQLQLSPAEKQALRDYGENPSLVVDPKVKAAYEKLQPKLQEIARVYAKLKGQGLTDKEIEELGLDVLPGGIRYFPRRVIAVGGQGLRPSDIPGGGKLGKSAGFLRGRTFVAAMSPRGERAIITADQAEKLQAQGWKIGHATTQEIERLHPEFKYATDGEALIQNTWLRARQVERATEFIESTKSLLKQTELGTDAAHAPYNWATTSLPQLRGWKMDPKIAAVFDRYNREFRSSNPAFGAVNRTVIQTLFMANPLIHYLNLLTNWTESIGMIERGVHPFSNIKSFAKSIRTVLFDPDEMIDLMRQGHPGEFQRFRNRKTLENLAAALRQEDDPTLLSRLQNILGPTSKAKNFLQNVSNGLTWFGDDLLRTQTIYELEARGMSRAEAIKYTNRFVPDYTTSAVPAGSVKLGKILNNSDLLMFQAYHTGTMRAWRETFKDAAVGNLPDRARAIDRLLTLGFIRIVLLPAAGAYAAKILSAAAKTPEEKARYARAGFRSAGLLTYPEQIYRLGTGQTTVQQAVQSALTPAPILQLGSEVMSGRSSLTGKPLTTAELHREPGKYIAETARGLGGQVAPIHAASPLQWILSSIGLSAPKLLPEEIKVAIRWPEMVKGRNTEIRKLMQDHKPQDALRVWNQTRQDMYNDWMRSAKEQYRRKIRPTPPTPAEAWAWVNKEGPRHPTTAMSAPYPERLPGTPPPGRGLHDFRKLRVP